MRRDIQLRIYAEPRRKDIKYIVLRSCCCATFAFVNKKRPKPFRVYRHLAALRGGRYIQVRKQLEILFVCADVQFISWTRAGSPASAVLGISAAKGESKRALAAKKQQNGPP